jgi:hypothetical protein
VIQSWLAIYVRVTFDLAGATVGAVVAGASVMTGASVAGALVAGVPQAVISTLKTMITLNNLRSIFLLFMKSLLLYECMYAKSKEDVILRSGATKNLYFG